MNAEPVIHGYHWRDGWHFTRCPDGSVRIMNGRTPVGVDPIDLTIPPNEWASIIANVSARGETSNSYYLAGVFHDTLQALVTP